MGVSRDAHTLRMRPFDIPPLPQARRLGFGAGVRGTRSNFPAVHAEARLAAWFCHTFWWTPCKLQCAAGFDVPFESQCVLSSFIFGLKLRSELWGPVALSARQPSVHKLALSSVLGKAFFPPVSIHEKEKAKKKGTLHARFFFPHVGRSFDLSSTARVKI